MAESINGTNGVPSLEVNAFPTLESAPEKIVEDVPSVSNEALKGFSAAEKLMQQHALAAQKDEIAEAEEPKASGLAAAANPKKKAGKQKESAPTVSRGLDISSAEAFPSLGGPAKSAPAVAWGAKMATPANGNDNFEVNTRVLTPALVGSSGQQIVELSPAQKRPLADLRKTTAEIVREIMKKTNTKIDMAQTMTKTTVFIVNGTETNRQRARREIFRELSLKVFPFFDMIISTRVDGIDWFFFESLDVYYHPDSCHRKAIHHWKRRFEGPGARKRYPDQNQSSPAKHFRDSCWRL